MIPYRSNRLYTVPQTLEKRLEIVTAIRALFDQDNAFEKFDPNQPRVPAGNADGGRWTDSGASDPQSIVAAAQRAQACWGSRPLSKVPRSLLSSS